MIRFITALIGIVAATLLISELADHVVMLFVVGFPLSGVGLWLRLTRWGSAGASIAFVGILALSVGATLSGALLPTQEALLLVLATLLWWLVGAEAFLNRFRANHEQIQRRLALGQTPAEALADIKSKTVRRFALDSIGASGRTFAVVPLLLVAMISAPDPLIVGRGIALLVILIGLFTLSLAVAIDLAIRTWLPQGEWNVPEELLLK